MIHSPCNNQNSANQRCRKKDPNKCDANFPKDFAEETQLNVNGYPKYKRPWDGRTDYIHRGNTTMKINNQ